NAGTVNFTDSVLGSASSPVTVGSRFEPITLNNTGAYGDFTAPSYSSVVLNGNSYVIGTCSPNSCTPPPLCDIASFSDNFNRSSLGSNWTSRGFLGSLDPGISGQRLLLTEDENNQSTAVTLQRWFPAANNKIQIE